MEFETQRRLYNMKRAQTLISEWCDMVEGAGNEMAYTDSIAADIETIVHRVNVSIEKELFGNKGE